MDNWLITASQVSILIPTLAGIYYYRNLNRPFRLLVYFFVLCIGFEIGASILGEIYKNNMPLLRVFTVTEYFFIIQVYYYYFAHRASIRKVIIVLSAALLLLAIADAFIIGNIWSGSSNTRTYEGIILVLLSLSYFYEFFLRNFDVEVWKQPMFWLSTAVLIYFSLNIFFFMLMNYMFKSNQQMAGLAIHIHAIVNIFANIIYAQAFRCFRKTISY